MNFYVYAGRSKWIAMAKEEPFIMSKPSCIDEPGDVYFDMGNTAEEAITKLRESLRMEEFDLSGSFCRNENHPNNYGVCPIGFGLKA